MKLYDFLKEKKAYLLSMSIVFIITVFILCTLNPAGGKALSMLIAVLYILGNVIPLYVEYMNKKDFYNNLLRIFDSLDRKNLIAEVITPPGFREGNILYDIIRGSNKAMLEEINKYKYMQEEYREYIEMWIHEVKTPISASRLIAMNNRCDAMDSICEEIEKIEAYVEQVLFYSRSNTVEKDYIIREIILEELCFYVLKKNSGLFIQNNISVDTANLQMTVCSDEKWLQFILSQILTNSVKYSDKPDARVKISACEMENSVVLSIEDNGTGIPRNELPRIFDKGFTGTNGRKNARSTGMGLYICRKLCDKLGLAISADSDLGKGTVISIVFPKNSMLYGTK